MGLLNRIEELEKELLELKELVKEEQEFPRDGDNYWYINPLGIALRDEWLGFVSERYMIEIGNVFKTEQDAHLAVEKLKIEAELRKFSRPFEEDDNNYLIELSMFDKTLTVEDDECWPIQGVIYFESIEKALQAIESVGEERIKKYIFRVED